MSPRGIGQFQLDWGEQPESSLVLGASRSVGDYAAQFRSGALGTSLEYGMAGMENEDTKVCFGVVDAG